MCKVHILLPFPAVVVWASGTPREAFFVHVLIDGVWMAHQHRSMIGRCGLARPVLFTPGAEPSEAQWTLSWCGAAILRRIARRLGRGEYEHAQPDA